MDQQPEQRTRNANGTFAKGHARLERAHRARGTLNKLTADIRRDCISGFAQHGFDGKGKDGFRGYVRFLATKHPKAAARLIEKILPYVVNGSGVAAAISTVNITSIPSGSFLSASDIEKFRAPAFRAPALLEHEPTRVSTIEQPAPVEQSIVQESEVEVESEQLTPAEARTINDLRNEINTLARKMGLDLAV